MKKLKINKKKLIKLIVETVVVWALTIWLFIVCKEYAELERGYAAFGGEYLAFLVAALWYIIPRKVKEPTLSANSMSPKRKKSVSSYYHEIGEVSSNGKK